MREIYYKKVETIAQCNKIKKYCEAVLDSIQMYRIDTKVKDSSDDNQVLASSCLTIKSRIKPGSYLIFYVNNDEIYRMSVWSNHPDSYKYQVRVKCIDGIPLINSSNIFYNIIEAIRSIFIKQILQPQNSRQNDQDQLQGKDSPRSDCGEGCTLHGGRDKFKYSTGRHCNEASAQMQRSRARRYQIILSSRTPEVLRY